MCHIGQTSSTSLVIILKFEGITDASLTSVTLSHAVRNLHRPAETNALPNRRPDGHGRTLPSKPHMAVRHLLLNASSSRTTGSKGSSHARQP